jgi:2,3-dihydroxybenzoate decarboxylase
MRKIALEEHFTIHGYDHFGSEDSAADEVGGGFQRVVRNALADFGEIRLQHMDASEIERAVLSLTIPGVHNRSDAHEALKLARIANDFLAAEIAKRPDRYSGFAHLPLQDATIAADELERCVRDLGFKGAMVHGHTCGRYLDEDAMSAFWERVETLGVPVYLHVTDPVKRSAVLEGYPMLDGPLWGWMAETGAHLLRLIFSGMFDRYPGCKVIIGHMGEGIPFQLWRLDNWVNILFPGRRFKEPPSYYIRKNIYVTISGVCAPEPLRYTIDALGKDHVLFATDYPYESSEMHAQFIDSAPISDDERRMVCYDNAANLLRI